MAPGESTVHETAMVGAGVVLGEGVVVGAYCILGDGVRIGDGSVLAEHAVVRTGVVVGNRSRVESFAVIGGDPQDLSFEPETVSGVVVGDDVVIREGVTIHRATTSGGNTVIGDHCYLMATSHVAHDCRVAERVILVNGVLLGGHVTVGSHTMLGGAVGVHQFTRIGEGVMIGGNGTATYDVPPFTMAADRNGLSGLNLVGLRRRGIPTEDIRDLKRCYHEVYRDDNPVERAAAAIASGDFGTSDVGRAFLQFFAGGTRGFLRPRKG
jgi:UDP-N-acetylglucosamine acyltransferase